MDEREFRRAFEACSLPEERFRHADHLRMAWLFLSSDPLLVALERFPSALRRFAESLGKTTLYHETITWAYLFLVHERMARMGHRTSWEDFARKNPDLLSWRPGILERYYRTETLQSDLARRVFLMPDSLIDPLSAAGLAGRCSGSSRGK